MEDKSISLEKLPHESSSVVKDVGTIHTLTDGRSNQTIPIKKLKAFLGLFYLSLSSLSLQLISVIVQNLSYISVCQLSLTRYAGIFAFALPMVIYYKQQFLANKKHRLLIVLRGLLAANGLYFQIIAYRHLQLVQASIVMSIFPFATAIIARIFIKEPLGFIQISTMVITISGVLLSLRLPEELNNKTQTHFDVSFIIGIIASILSVLCLALSTVALRKLKEVHYSIILLYVSVIGMIENAVLNGIFFPLVAINCGWHQILCTLLGIFAVTSQCFMILATKLEPAGLVAVQKSSFNILVAALYQILFFANYPDKYVISGTCLVLVSLIIIGVKNWVLTLPETSEKRKRLKWILL